MAVAALALPLASSALFANAAPVVDELTAVPAVVAPDELVEITVEAHDPDCPATCTTGCGLYVRADLTNWTATGGAFESESNGISGSPYTASATWRAPLAEGTYTITVDLADSGSFFCGGRASTSGSLDVLVTNVTTQPPEIQLLTANPPQLFPGETSRLTCVASDPDGDPLTFAWATDLGSLNVVAPGIADLTIGVPGIATARCTVTDPFDASDTASVPVSVSGVTVDKELVAGLSNPRRVAVDSRGSVFVADRGGRGVSVVNLFDGQLLYELPAAGITSVAVDWADRLVASSALMAGVFSNDGARLLKLVPRGNPGEITDVAVDPVNRRYGVLHGPAGRVFVYDEGGGLVGAFGSTGDADEQLQSPSGLAATPGGHWVVADTGHGQIKVFDLSGDLLLAFGGLGGAADEFVALEDVEVAPNGLIFASDSFQDRIQVFDPDGSLREIFGRYGSAPGELDTATGIVVASEFERVLVASLNGSAVQVFRTSDALLDPPLPVPVVRPDSLRYPSTMVGSTSPPKNIELTNVGSAPFGLFRIEIPREFSAENDCGSFVDPGASCVIALRFAPTTPGKKGGVVRFETSAAAGPLTVAVAGTAFTLPELAVSPPELSFVDTPVGDAKGPETVVVTNLGTVATSFLLVGTSGDFAHASECPQILPGGASCAVQVYFTPTVPSDDLFGVMTIRSDATNDPSTVSLRGSSTFYQLTPDPGELVFEVVPVGEESPPRTATLSNTGDEGINLGTASIGGGHSSDFVVVEDGCSGGRLYAGRSCAVSIAFAPTELGRRTGLLEMPSFIGPTVVSLVGGSDLLFADGFETGTTARWTFTTDVELRGKPGTDVYATVTLSFTDEAVEIGAARLIGPERLWIEDDECSGRVLEPGDSCELTVGFAPTALESVRATMTVPACGATCETRTIRLLGNGAVD